MNLVVLIVCLTLSLPSFADGLVLIAEAGPSLIEIDGEFRPSEIHNSQNGNALGLSAGYKFTSNIVILGSANRYYGTNFFGANDRVHLTEANILLGYSLINTQHFRLLPMVGWSDWELESKEGALFNSGPEEVRVFKGESIIGKIIFELPIKDFFAMQFSLTHGEFDFGELSAIRIGAKFELF